MRIIKIQRAPADLTKYILLLFSLHLDLNSTKSGHINMILLHLIKILLMQEWERKQEIQKSFIFVKRNGTNKER